MRLAVDTVIALILLAILAGIGWHRHEQAVQLRRVEAVQASLRAIQAQAMYHAGLSDTDTTRGGYPTMIHREWFGNPPCNALVDDETTWMDQAAADERDRWDPLAISIEPDRAIFWYNPYRGIVRARVPHQISDRATCDLYNLVNGTSLEPDEVTW